MKLRPCSAGVCCYIGCWSLMIVKVPNGDKIRLFNDTFFYWWYHPLIHITSTVRFFYKGRKNKISLMLHLSMMMKNISLFIKDTTLSNNYPLQWIVFIFKKSIEMLYFLDFMKHFSSKWYYQIIWLWSSSFASATTLLFNQPLQYKSFLLRKTTNLIVITLIMMMNKMSVFIDDTTLFIIYPPQYVLLILGNLN